MSVVDAYLFLFFDSFIAMLIMVSNSHMAFKVMMEMGGYHNLTLLFIALLGDVLGGISNYFIGYIISYVQHNIRDKKPSAKLKSLTSYVQKKLFLLALFSFVPLVGVLLTTSSGFFRVNLKKFIPVLALGRVVYYLFLFWAAS